MITIVFGAGASHDSFLNPRDSRYEPPLANGLFNDNGTFGEILRKYPPANSIAALIRGRILTGDYIENILSDLLTPRNLSQITATLYYLQDLCGICSHYHAALNTGSTYSGLLYILENAGITDLCCITFNYDTLLEQALEELKPADYRFKQMESYIKGPIKIIKPHGSANWGQRIENLPAYYGTYRDRLNEVLMHPNALSLNGRIEVMPEPDGGQWSQGHSGETGLWFPLEPGRTGHPPVSFYPAIALPLANKDSGDFVCPLEHREVIQECLKTSDRLLVIGWKGAETHFKKLLSETVGQKTLPVMIVSPDDPRLIENELRQVIPNIHVTPMQLGFSQLLNTPELVQFVTGEDGAPSVPPQ